MATPGTRTLWLGYLAVTVALTVARGLAAEGSPAAVLITYAYPLVTIAAIAAGVRVNRPARRLPWILLLATLVTGPLGDITFGADPAGVFWAACYPIELTGLMLFLLLIARIAGLVRTVQDQAPRLESIAYLYGLTGSPNRRAGTPNSPAASPWPTAPAAPWSSA